MLQISLASLLLGLGALLLGLNQIAGVPFELGRFLFLIFLGLAVLSFVGALLNGRFAKSD